MELKRKLQKLFHILLPHAVMEIKKYSTFHNTPELVLTIDLVEGRIKETIWGNLAVCRDEVSIFYSPSRRKIHCLYNPYIGVRHL